MYNKYNKKLSNQNDNKRSYSSPMRNIDMINYSNNNSNSNMNNFNNTSSYNSNYINNSSASTQPERPSIMNSQDQNYYSQNESRKFNGKLINKIEILKQK